MNLAIFLSQIRSFTQRKGIEIDENALGMLSSAIFTIDTIISNATIKPTDEKDNVDFIFNLDSNVFNVRPYITCGSCMVSSFWLGFSTDFSGFCHFALDLCLFITFSWSFIFSDKYSSFRSCYLIVFSLETRNLTNFFSTNFPQMDRS